MKIAVQALKLKCNMKVSYLKTSHKVDLFVGKIK